MGKIVGRVSEEEVKEIREIFERYLKERML